MTNVSFTFNGEVTVTLAPKSAEDTALLDLVFNGREVRTIKSGADGSIVLVLAKPSGVVIAKVADEKPVSPGAFIEVRPA